MIALELYSVTLDHKFNPKYLISKIKHLNAQVGNMATICNES